MVPRTNREQTRNVREWVGDPGCHRGSNRGGRSSSKLRYPDATPLLCGWVAVRIVAARLEREEVPVNLEMDFAVLRDRHRTAVDAITR